MSAKKTLVVGGGQHAADAILALSVALTDDLCAFLEAQTGKRPAHRGLVVATFEDAFRNAYADVVEQLAKALEIAVERTER